jgi:hypothetical protein
MNQIHRKCIVKNKLVSLQSDCKICPFKDQCQNPGGPDMNKDRKPYQVIVK